MSADAPAAAVWKPSHNPWAIALTVTMATFMEVLDTSVANVSLPHIAGDLSAGQDESTWVLTSYLVSNAIVLPISGWIANKVGRKRFYMSCVALFTISSFLCGVAPNLGMLIFFRVLQGVGGGGLGPSEQSILADTFAPEKRGMAFAIYGMAVVLAPAIGPTLGGWITDHYSWRWIFFINVPVGILSLFLSNKMVEDPPYLAELRKQKQPIDYAGLFLIALGLASLEVVLDKGQEEDWFHSSFIVGFAVTSAVSLISFCFWEWFHEYPVVDIRLFKQRNFATANVMMLTLGMTLFGTTVLLPQYLQGIMGYSAEQSGEALSPGGIAIVLLMPLIGRLVSRVDPRKMIAFGFTCVSLALFYMGSHLYGGIDFSMAVKLRVYQAVGMAFLFVPINTLVYVGVPPHKNNAVSGMVNLSRNMGGDIGIALVTTLIARRSQIHQSNLVAHTSVFNNDFSSQARGIAQSFVHAGTSAYDASIRAYALIYRSLVQQATTLAYIDTIMVFAVITMLMVPLAFLMKRNKPGQVSMGH